ncbi:serine/threonine-protein kinase [Hyalangium rubrum]|uniref:Serine/threonine-protein kinase n=1 Tax=Hyalangium rubrum TaxID=3103134 RepID=A0ABU5HGS4_9BACT|nr:serine/threonine-protein kinase [Hyalangium sp. s54d21]MDY7232656.1 serine/threonine-protein kinase [Hyalangium sp. s54d21]
MELTRGPELNPAALPSGTKVGAWRVVSLRSRGTYGAVYRAVSAGAEESGHVALKLALHPRDLRFAREAELLLRVRHPCVPALLDQGVWRSPGRGLLAYLVMPWVEGAPLYAWATAHNPTSREVLRLIAQLAQALDATHQAGCLHRDVKGDNLLVGPEGQAFLLDFGSGTWSGAPRLTDDLLPPGTPEYRSPEALRFQARFRDTPGARYVAGAADDLYALGVTAHRVLTGQYPSPEVASRTLVKRSRATGQVGAALRVAPELVELIDRLLAETPEARGSAREVAEAAEAALKGAGPEADVPVRGSARGSAEAVEERERGGNAPTQERARIQEHAWKWLPWIAMAAMGLHLILKTRWEGVEARATQPEAAQDDSVVALGSTAVATPASSAKPSRREPIMLDLPREPFPGQRRPDANGRCYSKLQVAINGGCWLALDADTTACNGDGYVYKGKCYVPVFPPIRAPTSDPP